MSALLAYSLSLRGFFAVFWRKIHVFAALCAAWILLLLAVAPSSFADDKTPQDEYEAALESSYATVFAGADVSDKQVSSFASCLSDTTYSDLSAETITALTSGNLDYEINSDEADIFLNAVETCLADNDLSDVVIAPESEGDVGEADGDGGASVAETGKDSEPSPASASAEKAPTYLLPLATGLTLLALIAFAFYLLIRGKSRDAHEADSVSAEDTNTKL